jgi:hypothetical protein
VRARPPVSNDGPLGAEATSGEVPELERRQAHDTGTSRQQRHHHPHPKAETPEPLEPTRRLDPATAPTTRLARPNPPCLASPR